MGFGEGKVGLEPCLTRLVIGPLSAMEEDSTCLAQSAGAVEYIDSISALVLDAPNKCPGYDTEQSDGEASVMLELWGMLSTPSFYRCQVHSVPER